MSSKETELKTIATLHIHSADKEPRSFQLHDGQTVSLGREPDNGVVLNDLSVSRRHASFSASSYGVVVADLGSLNGTFVNGEPLTSMKDLTPSDVVDIGASKITLQLASSGLVEDQAPTRARAKTAKMRRVSVSILLASIRNYNELCREIKQEQLDGMLESWRKRICGAVQHYNGNVDKLIGGSVVATWVGVAAQTLAINATQAASHMRKDSLRLSGAIDLSMHGDYPWEFSVVINSGHGLEGSLGVESDGSAQSFTILGNPTNLAFRLQEQILDYDSHIFLSTGTADLVADAYSLRKLGDMQLEDLGQEVEIFTIVE